MGIAGWVGHVEVHRQAHCAHRLSYRVHKCKAVVRHMFWNAQDIKYFKPLEVSTKHGLRGHITESLGTHGYMKCRFNDRIKHDDTICINLYKRVYPRWNSLAWGRADQKPEDD